MSAADWKIEVRDANLNRLGEVDDYQQFDLNLKFNDVSTWRLTVNRRVPLAAALRTPGAGIVVSRNGGTVMSGYWTEEVQTGGSRDELVLSGVDDTAWLGRRYAHPQPGSADTGPPYSTQAADVRTGQASTIIRAFVSNNADGFAPSVRKVPGLAVGGDPNLGPNLTGSGRWQSLLTLVQELTSASEALGTPIGFVIRQTGDILSFFQYAVVDASATVRFSLEMGNLAEYTYRTTAPTCTYAVVGGSGEGTARTIFEKPNSEAIALWGRIEGDLVDSSNADTPAERTQAADKELLDGAAKTSLAITPIDLDVQKYGVHYALGFKVTVALDTIGPVEETVTATAQAQGTSVTTGYLIALEAAALPFPNGTRARLMRDGHLKEPGVRVVTGRTTAFGFTNIDFYPAADVSTEVGDYLEAITAPQTTGEQIVDIVREVNISLTPDAEKITPALGSGAASNPIRIFDTVKRQTRRLNNIERR